MSEILNKIYKYIIRCCTVHLVYTMYKFYNDWFLLPNQEYFSYTKMSPAISEIEADIFIFAMHSEQIAGRVVKCATAVLSRDI